MVSSFCSHISECGGCTFQQIPYSVQLHQKQKEINHFFPDALPIIPSQSIWHYRNKMEFSFSQNKAKEKFLGLIMRKSRGKIFNLQECYLAPPWMAQTLQQVKTWWEGTNIPAFNFYKGSGCLQTLTLREGVRTNTRMAMLTVSSNPSYPIRRGEINSFLASLQDPQMAVFLRLRQSLRKIPTQFYEIHLNGPTHILEKLALQYDTLTFSISPSSFFQPNTAQAEVLYNQALSMTEENYSLVYDLYCGTATLGISFAKKARKVIGVELNPYAVFDARENIENNRIENVFIECDDVINFLNQPHPPSSPTADLIIVDPPRAGLDPKVITKLCELKAKHILYISCNPRTQVQNISQLSGYRIVKAQPVDQFPHTPHMENIVLLSR
jgi:23S rRNA (uracil1939-C5)-methyltransferase